MGTAPGRVLQQPFVGIGTTVAALIALAASWPDGVRVRLIDPATVGPALLTLCLVACIVLAYTFPIYIRHNTKVCVFSAPLYLLAVLLPPPLAASAAGLGILAGEVVVRSRHGNQPCDIATHTGRWVVVILLGSRLAHAPLPATDILLHSTILVATAVALLLGDTVTSPLALAPICDEPVDRIIISCLREGGLVEGAQYLTGIGAALVMQEQAWAFILFALPLVLLYLGSRKEVDPETYQLLESMADAVDLRDPYTVEHSRRVGEVTRSILEELGRNGQEAALIRMAARLHDIGKVAVPDHVLLKRETLSEEERALVEAHAEQSGELLERYPDFARMVEMVRHHHERWDGAGYPDGLAGTDIPFGARIIAVAEGFDAMTSDQSYRRAVAPDRAAGILADGRGRQWDPTVVDALLRRLGYRPDQPLASVPGPSPAEGRDMAASAVSAR
jgi:HD-GYP domain-containing protein (c-di-GMP phosphodiesterase class II)